MWLAADCNLLRPLPFIRVFDGLPSSLPMRDFPGALAFCAPVDVALIFQPRRLHNAILTTPIPAYRPTTNKGLEARARRTKG